MYIYFIESKVNDTQKYLRFLWEHMYLNYTWKKFEQDTQCISTLQSGTKC